MILVDTSVWIDHFRSTDLVLAALLDAKQVIVHPFVIGELALGTLAQRETLLESLQELPQAGVATDREVLHFIDKNRLFGLGIGYVDVHLLASAALTENATLWTLDKKLARFANASVPHNS